MSEEKNTFVSRINQVDAVQLDDEIYKVLRSQIDEVAKYFAPGKIARWRPEIDVLVKYFVWNYSLKAESSTFGQRLLNLSYKNSLDRRKSLFLLVFLTLPDYLRERFVKENFILSWLPSSYQRSKYRGYIEQVDNFFHLLNFIWVFFFLNLGNQPRFVEWLLGLYNQQLENTRKARSIGYSYMTRELLWHGLIELFTISLPTIDFRRIQKLFSHLWTPKKSEKNLVLACELTLDSVCAYCGETPILPRWAGCPHVFCYYCLEGLFMTVDMYRCTVCDSELHSANIKCC